MTNFENYKQQYLNNKPILNKILHHKNKSRFINLVNPEGLILFKSLIKQVELKINNKPSDLRSFFTNIPFSTKKAQELTNLNPYKQRKGLYQLEEMGLITIIYKYDFVFNTTSRLIKINFDMFDEFYNCWMYFRDEPIEEEEELL